MYCSKCGKQLDDNAVICPQCGAPTGVKPQSETAVKPKEKNNFWFGLLSVLFPLVGLIFFLVWLKEKPNRAKICGICALAMFVIEIVLGVILGIFLTVLIVFYEPPTTGGNETVRPPDNGNNNGGIYVPPVDDSPVYDEWNYVPYFEDTADGVLTFTGYGEDKHVAYDEVLDAVIVWDNLDITVYNRVDGAVIYSVSYMLDIAAVDSYDGVLCVGFCRPVRRLDVHNLLTGEVKTVSTSVHAEKIIVADDMAIFCDSDQWCKIYKLDLTNYKQTLIKDLNYNPEIALNHENRLLYVVETGSSSCNFYYIGLDSYTVKSLAGLGEYVYNSDGVYYDGEYVYAFGNTYDALTGEKLLSHAYDESFETDKYSLYKTVFSNKDYSFILTYDFKTVICDKADGDVVYSMCLFASDIYYLGGDLYFAVCKTGGYTAYIHLDLIPSDYIEPQYPKASGYPPESPFPEIPDYGEPVYNDSADGVLKFTGFGMGNNICYDLQNDYLVVWDNFNVKVYDRQSGAEVYKFNYLDKVSSVSVYNGVLCVGFAGEARRINIYDLCTGENRSVTTLADVNELVVTDGMVIYDDYQQFSSIYMLYLTDDAQVCILSLYQPTFSVNHEQGILYVAETDISSSEFYYVDLKTFKDTQNSQFSDYWYNYDRPYFDGEQVHWFGNTYDAVTGEFISTYGYAELIRPFDEMLSTTLCRNERFSLISTVDNRTVVYDREIGEIVYSMELCATEIYDLGGDIYLAVCGDSGYAATIDLNKI